MMSMADEERVLGLEKENEELKKTVAVQQRRMMEQQETIYALQRKVMDCTDALQWWDDD